MTAIMVEAAVRGLLLAIAVGAGLGLFRVTNVPMRKVAWSLVLVASLAMPFLMHWPAMAGLSEGIGWVVPIHRVAPAVSGPLDIGPAIASRETSLSAGTAAPARRMRTHAMPLAAVPTYPKTAKHEGAGERPVAFAAAVAVERSAPREPLNSSHRWQWQPVGRILVGLYVAVTGFLLVRLLWGVGAAAWLWVRAEEVSPLDVPEENVRVSRWIPSPVTIGRGIVLPESYREWNRAKLRVVLAHERSHVRQMDFYLQLLAGVYAAAFWFSPLGWWLKRELSHLGEAISDRAGLQAARSRSDYAGVLLEFAATARHALPGVAMARKGNLSRRVDQLLNEKLFQRAFAEGRRRAAVALLLVPAALFAVTALVRVPGAAAQTQEVSQISPIPAVAPAAPEANRAQPASGQSNPVENQVTTMSVESAQAPAAPPPPPVPDTGETATPENAAPIPQAAPAPQAVPAPPAEPAAPKIVPVPPEPLSDDDLPTVLEMAPMPEVRMLQPKMNMALPKSSVMLNDAMPQLIAQEDWENGLALAGPGENFYFGPGGGTHGYAYYFSSNGDSWAIVDGAGKNFTMGSGSDRQSLDLAQRMARGPFLWFSHDGKSYIVDDAAVVARIQSLYAPMRDLAHQRDALAVQERVMARMEAERARQDRTEASVRVPDLSKEMADVQATLNSLKSQQGQMLSEEKLAEMQARLAEMEARLGSLQARSAMQNNFAEKMRVLSEQQRQMAEQQRQFSEKEKTLATQAQQQVQSIIQECLRNGKATPVK